MVDILDEIKGYLAIDLTDTTNDVLLNRLTASAQKEVENYLNSPFELVSVVARKLNVRTTTYIYNDLGVKVGIFTGNQVRFYYNVPVSVSSIYYRADSDDDATLISDEYYDEYFDGYVYVIEFSDYYNSDYIYTINLAVGWENASIPEDIMDVLIEMVSIKYLQSPLIDKTLGLNSKATSLSGGNASDSFKDMRNEWRSRVDPYKMIGL